MTMQATQSRGHEPRLLVTGACGHMGRTLMRHWRSRSPVGLDLANADWCVDLTRGGDGARDAFRGVGTVVHLAANPDPKLPFETACRDNLLGTMAVVEASLRAGVARIVYASSIWADQASWGLPEPRTWYAASKIAGEAVVRAWADQTGHAAVCLRLGYYDAGAGPVRERDEFPRLDATSLCWHFDRALDGAARGCTVRYAVGKLGEAATSARPVPEDAAADFRELWQPRPCVIGAEAAETGTITWDGPAPRREPDGRSERHPA